MLCLRTVVSRRSVAPLRRTLATVPHAQEASGEDFRELLLQRSLPLVPSYGWSISCLSEGAKSIGLPPTAHGLCEDGSAGLVKYFLQNCNEDLARKLDDGTTHKHMSDVEKMERLKYAMRLRLAMTEPYAHKWPEALVAMKMSPHYIQSLLGALHTDINEISYYAGNDATNFDWYTGRTALSTVYTATEMFMTQDRSPHFEATYQFLDQRLDDLSKVQNTTQQIEDTLGLSAATLSAAVQTAQNMAGFGSRR